MVILFLNKLLIRNTADNPDYAAIAPDKLSQVHVSRIHKNLLLEKGGEKPSHHMAGRLPVCSLVTQARIHVRIEEQLIEVLDIFQRIERQLL